MKLINNHFSFNSYSSAICKQLYRNWLDILTVIVLAIFGGCASYLGSQLIDPIIFSENSKNLWFEADITRVFANMTSRESNHYRTSVHPLFSLITYPLVSFLITIFQMEPIMAARVIIAMVASLWLLVLFALLRLMGCRWLDSVLLSILAAVSAAAMFWFVVPETYSLGSLSILLGLIFVELAQQRQFTMPWYVAINVITVGITVTNWMVGFWATVVNQSRKRSLWIFINTFFSVAVLSIVQLLIFSRSRLPLATRTDVNYVLTPESGGPLQVFKSFVFHTIVMPAVLVVDRWDTYADRNWATMITQNSDPGSGGAWGIFAVVLWIAVLSLGLWGFFCTKKLPKLRLVLGLTLLGQLALHIIYGEETFLYSLHIAPLLLIIAAFATLTKVRLPVLVLTAVLIISLTINNTSQFLKVASILHDKSLKNAAIEEPIFITNFDLF